MENGFLPAGYEIPKSGGGYTELKAGDNKLRILSNPLMLWLEWRDGKPIRHLYLDAQNKPVDKPAKGSGQKDSVKHAWAMIVFNYDTDKIEIFECDKVEVISTVKALADKPAWGHPKRYDLNINKSGSGMDTEYKTTPEPPTEPSDHIVAAFTENPIDLMKLLGEESPFLSAPPTAANPDNLNTAPVVQQTKVVTVENWVKGDPAPAGCMLIPDDWDGITFPDGWVNSGVAGLWKKKLPF